MDFNMLNHLLSSNFYLNKFKKITEYSFIILRSLLNLGKVYILPKIHKRLENVLAYLVISKCGTTTEEVSELLDFHLMLCSLVSFTLGIVEMVQEVPDVRLSIY